MSCGTDLTTSVINENLVYAYVPEGGVILPHDLGEVGVDNGGEAGVGAVSKRQRLLPREFGGESAGEAAGIAAMVAGFAEGYLLVGERHGEEEIGGRVELLDELGVNAVVDDHEEPMLAAGLVDEVGGVGDGGGVPRQEASEVDGWDVEPRRRVGGGPLVVGPDELGRDVGLVLDDGGVEGKGWHCCVVL